MVENGLPEAGGRNGLTQAQRMARVLRLLDESYLAHARGNKESMILAYEQAQEVDDAVVIAVRGGLMIGEIPRPEDDYPAWEKYVEAAQRRSLA
jgi:hypothetical protein